MHPLYIIARREFLQRVRQKSFWIMLLLGPFFLMVIMIVPIGLAMEKEHSLEILYCDKSGLLDNYFYSEPELALVKVDGGLKQCYTKAKKGGYSGLIWVDRDTLGWQCQYYQAGLGGPAGNLIKEIVQRRITEYELTEKQNISLPKISYRIAAITETEKGEPDGTMGFVAGLFAAVLVLVFINQYSHMVLRGVVEEKQNRISELILTSVKPMFFISGKIAGIASVAFLQILIWVMLSGAISLSVATYFKIDRFSDENLAGTLQNAKDIPQTLEMNSMLNSITSINGAGLFAGFIFYFVFGYLLYSSFFAIIGISVGSDTDAQQMAIPFTLPLSVPIILLQYITEHPDSGLSLFLSLFPLTSPTTMLLRLPYNVPLWQLILSASILIFTLVLSAWLAAKIYRIGIFMYGKKLNIQEVLRLSGLAKNL